ncbi:MAG: hypothetical protein NTZ04_01505 [Chloroflexi bacterium]|nr:hypothetical protein [Chloroflexota bacterium]
MSFPSLLIALLADFLASADAYLANCVNVPANASGPLDPNITLTGPGVELVHELARTAISWSATLALTLRQLV